MFQKINTYLKKRKKLKQIEKIKALASSQKVLKIKNNKELTDTEEFVHLLNLFQNVSIKEIYLSQNTNKYIITFSSTIYDFCSTMEMIRRCVNSYNESSVRVLGRLPKRSQLSFVFFNDKESNDANHIFDNRTLNQLVTWMRDILVYFEEHKTSQEPEHENLCNAIYSKLDLLYLSYYHLLCNVLNIQCENVQTLAVFDNSDF